MEALEEKRSLQDAPTVLQGCAIPPFVSGLTTFKSRCREGKSQISLLMVSLARGASHRLPDSTQGQRKHKCEEQKGELEVLSGRNVRERRAHSRLPSARHYHLEPSSEQSKAGQNFLLTL